MSETPEETAPVTEEAIEAAAEPEATEAVTVDAATEAVTAPETNEAATEAVTVDAAAAAETVVVATSQATEEPATPPPPAATPAPSPAQAPLVPPPPAPLVAPEPVPGAAPYAQQPQQQPQYGAVPQPEFAAYPVAMYAPVPPKPKRTFPWRWAGAVVTVLAVGGACAYGVLAQKRTDLPGLATASDGRYDFAPISMPTLAPGQSDPTAESNVGSRHLSDIRKLLLPAPAGATKDKSLPGASGWVGEKDTLAVAKDTSEGKESFGTNGWRHTAGTAWKTPDGAETKIYLVQFIDGAACKNADSDFAQFTGGLNASPKSITVNSSTSVGYTKVTKGATTTWSGAVAVGDTEFLITFTAPNSVGLAPFEQEVDLQVELLQ